MNLMENIQCSIGVGLIIVAIFILVGLTTFYPYTFISIEEIIETAVRFGFMASVLMLIISFN